MNLLDALLGPLATFECRRAARPRWVLWVRLLAALPAAAIVLVVGWIWTLLGQLDPTFLPYRVLTGGLIAIEMVELFLALLLSPALIAGAIAGEKDRGTLGMLLASRLTAREIILGRLAGCFSQVAMLAVAGIPPLVFLAALCGTNRYQLALLTAMPAAVAFGSAGLTVAASTLARRGRDALWTVYVIEILLLAAVMLGTSRFHWLSWFSVFSPFAALPPLISGGDPLPATASLLLWLGLGCLGTAVAIGQLRPAYRRQTGGEVRGHTKGRRVVPLADRPMLWKELYFERTGSFGAFGRWLTRLLVAVLAGAGLVVLGAVCWRLLTGASDLPYWSERIALTIGYSSFLLLWLSQWMIGLRAVGVIASERQRSTWDAILASPLEAKEIIVAKSCGSVYSLRWLIAAMVLAWTASLVAGGLTISDFARNLALLAAGGAWMLVAGVAIGVVLDSAGSTRGMAIIIGLWMTAAVSSAVLAFLIAAILMLVATVIGVTLVLATSPPDAFVDSVGNYVGVAWSAGYLVIRVSLYLLATAALGLWLAANFDRLAGRMGSWSISGRLMKSFETLVELSAAGDSASQK